jgi:hypothetical protein
LVKAVLLEAAPAVVVAEQLVRAVEEMNHHGVTRFVVEGRP